MASVLIFRYVAESKLEIVKNTALELEYVFNTISPVPMKFTIDDVELAVRKSLFELFTAEMLTVEAFEMKFI